MNHAPQGASAYSDRALWGAYNHACDQRGKPGYRAALEDLIRVHALEQLAAMLPELARSEFVQQACLEKVERQPELLPEWEALFGPVFDYAPIPVAA